MPVDYHSHHVPAQAHLADVELPNGDIPPSDAAPLHDNHIPSETPSPDSAALGVASHIPSSAVLNTDYFFEAYYMHDLSPVFFMVMTPHCDVPSSSPLCDFIQKEGPVAFTTFQQRYNIILDSGCTSHIFCDCSVFWTYDPEHAVSVQTVNCGTLHTLAHGDVKFCVQCRLNSVVVTLHDCLHVPDVPLNLISVGALQEHGM